MITLNLDEIGCIEKLVNGQYIKYCFSKSSDGKTIGVEIYINGLKSYQVVYKQVDL